MGVSQTHANSLVRPSTHLDYTYGHHKKCTYQGLEVNSKHSAQRSGVSNAHSTKVRNKQWKQRRGQEEAPHKVEALTLVISETQCAGVRYEVQHAFQVLHVPLLMVPKTFYLECLSIAPKVRFFSVHGKTEL